MIHPPSGYILFRKSPGVTSFTALGAVKEALNTGKVGHTGTLDKFASGLLVLLTGRALKLSPWFSHCDKEYEGTILFGRETDSLDSEGSVTAEAPPPSREAVEALIPRFTGDILQAPPLYSAVHINGRRASARARAGEKVEMKKRPVSIYSLEILSWAPDPDGAPLAGAKIRLRCSSGTYVRSLARDLGLAAGSRAHLIQLERTKVAGFSLAMARDNFDVRPVDAACFDSLGLPWREINSHDVQKIRHGKSLSGILDQPVPLQAFSRPKTASALGLFYNGSFAAMVEEQNGVWRYGCVWPEEPCA
jgi:tRNA pseudouridine55 synthase